MAIFQPWFPHIWRMTNYQNQISKNYAFFFPEKEANDMSLFMIHFLICNIYLCGIIGMLFLLKHICRKILSPRRQYQIWLLFLCLLAVAFLTISLKGIC